MIIEKYFTDFTPKQTDQFKQLQALYTEWNEKINVISRKDIDNFYLHHVLHSLSIAAIAAFKPDMEVLDIGCGGGFPSVPLAIFFPEVKFHLVDSIGKKLKVVNAICEAANITNITTQHTRVEDIKGKKFHFAVTRAVAPLQNLWQWANPLLRKGHASNVPNSLICLKGGDLHQEISESQTRPRLQPIYDFFEEDYFKEKFLVLVEKK